MGFYIHGVNPTTPSRFTSSSHIPNIRPQIDVNLFMSIFNTLEKFLPWHLRMDLVNRHDVIYPLKPKIPFINEYPTLEATSLLTIHFKLLDFRTCRFIASPYK